MNLANGLLIEPVSQGVEVGSAALQTAFERPRPDVDVHLKPIRWS